MKAARIIPGLLAAVCAAGGAGPAGQPAGGAGPVTHVLFMGSDLAVRRGGGYHRVEGVVGESFQITVDGRAVLVPIRPSPALFKIEPGLKLSRASATIGRYVHRPAYSAARDPMRKFEAASGAAAGAAAAADLALFEAREAASPLVFPGATSGFAPPGNAASLQENADAANRAYLEALAQQNSDQNITATHADRLRGDMSAGDFDAIEIVFEVSAPGLLEEPHVIVIAQYRERDAAPGVSRHWTHATTLPPVGPKPRVVRIREGGLPVGYILEDCRVHVYDRGREVATNLSPRRVELTREEAWQYLAIEHRARHAGTSVPPEPVVGELPADLAGRLAAGLHREPVHVKVDEAGRPRGAFRDARCTRAIDDPYVAGLVAGLLFAPALDKGRPVSGIARIELGSLAFR